DVFAFSIWGDRLPALPPHLGISKHAEYGSSQAGCNLHPLLYVLNVGGALGFVRDREIIPHSSPADSDAQLKGSPFEIVDIIIRWNGGVSGEKVSCWVDTVEIVLRAEVEEVEQTDSLAATAVLIVEQFAEGIGVERNFELRATGALDRVFRFCR